MYGGARKEAVSGDGNPSWLKTWALFHRGRHDTAIRPLGVFLSDKDRVPCSANGTHRQEWELRPLRETLNHLLTTTGRGRWMAVGK